MTTLPNYTPFYGGGQVANPANVISTSGAPNSSILSENRVGTIAIDNSAGIQYILASKAGGIDTWDQLSTSSEAGSFTTLTNTGAYTLGTAQLSAASTIGSGQTSGTIGIGGTSVLATGAISIAPGTGAQAINIATSTGIKTISIGTGAAANVLTLGATTGAATTTIFGGSLGTSLQTAGGGSISLLPGTGTTQIATDSSASTINIGAGASAAKTIVVGSTNTTSTTTVQSGTGGLVISTAGKVLMAPVLGSAASNAITLNGRVFQATLSGQTTAAAGTLVCTITNNAILATDSTFLWGVDNSGVNDAQMTVQRVQLATGSVVFTLKNNGAAALNGDIHINGWALN